MKPANEATAASRFYVAEMITHNFIFKGVDRNKEDARTALLNAWTAHRTALLAQYPERTASIPEAGKMEQHFRIYYLEFDMDAGYRGNDRLM
ncbi:hypothetical protein CAP31_00040 [Sulfuriferula sp. AH1]|uniref:hypothetical protein n=1 Tax=Sulfuriferula sp. AH1 TaxID=1985873 RepID=UPI000B3B9E51|nr:hypothetical protein [Sulfuriferula sp. AH1]ARU30226.1 hypothetical protein CAP31_00040 [Sulfuriferula sp. AH1]